MSDDERVPHLDPPAPHTHWRLPVADPAFIPKLFAQLQEDVGADIPLKWQYVNGYLFVERAEM